MKQELVYFCKECGHIEHWNTQLLKDKGEPVCPNCDTDLEIQVEDLIGTKASDITRILASEGFQAFYDKNGEPIGDIVFTHCVHDKPCHEPRYKVDVRIFGKKLLVSQYDYPSKVLPPYLKKKGGKK